MLVLQKHPEIFEPYDGVGMIGFRMFED